jgi:pilus assembly protein CpaF
LVVSGGAGAGKTTLLSALAKLIPPYERLVVLEDTRELVFAHPHAVSLQCRPSSGEGSATTSMGDLVRNSLRMRPDRILVGEIRGAEVADLVMAMNTGHEGCMTTLHANSASDVFDRLQMMMSLAWPGLDESSMSRWLTSALDLVVHCERDGGGKRRIVEVAAVEEGLPCPVYQYNRTSEIFEPSGGNAVERVLEKMRSRGIDFPEDLLR